MDNIGVILKDKGSDVLKVSTGATVKEAVEAMCARRVGSVLICDGMQCAGIFTERDLMRRVVRQGRDPKTTPVSAVMSPDVRQVPSTESIVETLRIMVEHGYRHMLVSDGDKPAGVVSIRDLMRWMILPDAPVAHEGRRGVIRTRTEDAVETLKQG